MDVKELLPWAQGHWPFDDSLNGLQKEFRRVFDDFARSLDTRTRGALTRFDPRINVTESESAIRVTAELPGMDEKDVEVSINEYALTIKGEKKWEKEEKDQDHHLIERSYGSFRRTIPLPQGVEAGQIQAVFKKGVLTVDVPKSKKVVENTKKIEIKPG